MATFGFVFRDGRLDMRAEHRGVERFVPTRYEVREAEWDAAAGWLVEGDAVSSRHRRLACYARAMSRDLRMLQGMAGGPCATAAEITAAYLRVTAGNQMLGIYSHVLSEELAREGQSRTARAYLTAARRFIDFNSGYDIRIDALNSGVVAAFERALAREGLTRNTVSFYMRTLRAVYNKAVSENVIPARLENPFEDAYTHIEISGAVT